MNEEIAYNDLEKLQEKINGNRVVSYPSRDWDKVINRHLKEADTGAINSAPIHNFCIIGCGDTPEEASKEFWLNYDSQAPYPDGHIFWRWLPVSYVQFFDEKEFRLVARFIIADPEELMKWGQEKKDG